MDDIVQLELVLMRMNILVLSVFWYRLSCDVLSRRDSRLNGSFYLECFHTHYGPNRAV